MSIFLPPEKLQFTDALGNGVDFLGLNINLTNHIGFEGPQPQHRMVEQPLRDGSRYIATHYREAFPIVQFDLEGDSYQNLMANRRLIIPVLSPKRGIGVLAYQSASGSQEFQIDALVERREHTGNPRFRVAFEQWTVQFRCPHPFWRTATAVETNVSGSTLMSNDGDVESFPTWTVIPGATIATPTFVNHTTGKSLQIRTSVNAGQTLIVDMLNRTAELDGVNVLDAITPASEFWSLVSGSNTVEAQHSTGTLTATMAHHENFEGV